LKKSDPAQIYSLMQQVRPAAPARVLWIADENIPLETVQALSAFESLTLITNRYDLAEIAKQALTGKNASVHYSDFDFAEPEIANTRYHTIFYRISKERPIVHWILNHSVQLLVSGGQLILAGQKNDGIKGYVNKCNKNLGLSGSSKKYGNSYLSELLYSYRSGENTPELLDHKNYASTRKIGEVFDMDLYSKPGIYGWEKIDEGSRLLTEQFYGWTQLNQDRDKLPHCTAIDLGCGYGYLSLALHAYGIANITATDNNAAAIALTYYNLKQAGAENFNVIAANCGDRIVTKADIILCNPPFHQGFGVDEKLTRSFVQAALRLLKPSGTAFFVVNAFIPLEKIAGRVFQTCNQLTNNGKFKVLELSNRKG